MTNSTYVKTTAALIAAWFIAALVASSRHVFENNSARLGLSVAIAALAPILLFALWFAISPGFRGFVRSLDPRVLTLVQTWRIGGVVFVVLYGFGILPGVFALPAGLGDMAIGATAPFIAWKLADAAHRSGFLLWQALGITDLVMAVSLGTTAPLLSANGASIAPMTVLPPSLVPTFFVPLLLIFHIICIDQARQWQAGQHPAVKEHLRSSAA